MNSKDVFLKKIDELLELIKKSDPLENELIQSHLFDLMQLEEDAMARLLPKYEAVAKELRNLLAQSMDYKFTTQHYNQVLAQVEAGIIQMKQVLMEELDANELTVRTKALEHLVSEIMFYEPAFLGTLQAINVRAVQAMDDLKKFRMLSYQATIDRYGIDLIARVQDMMVKSLVSQKFIYQLNTEIMEIIDSRFWKAQEIVRTELLNAYNEASLVGLQEAAKDLPGLKKQWLATLDGRTGQDSIALNGQIREVDKPFDYAGKPIDRPPTRPNCRCRIIPYKDDWEKGVKTDGQNV